MTRGERLALESSMTMNAVPSSVSPWSKISMMFGCASFCAAARLAPEPLADDRVAREHRVHDLDGDRLVDELVARAVDGRHAAFADDLLDDVAPGEQRADARIGQRDESRALDEAIRCLVRVPHLALRAGLQATRRSGAGERVH